MRKAFSQTFHTVGGIVFLQGIAFVATILIARSLSLEQLGRYQLTISISIFVTMLGTLGLDEAVAYLLPKYDAQQREKVFALVAYTLGISALISLVIGSLFYFSAGRLEKLLAIGGISSDLKFLLLLVPMLMVSSMELAVLRGLGRSEWRAYIYYYLIGVLFFAGIVFLRRDSLTSAEAYTARIFSLFIGAVVAGIVISKNVTARTEFLNLEDVRRLHSFAGALIFVGLFQYLVQQPLADLIIVGRYETEAVVGLYSVAARIAAVAGTIAVALNVVMVPIFSSLTTSGDVGRLQEQYHQASKWMAWGVIAAAIPILLCQRQILLIFGGDYTAGKRILQVLLFSWLSAGLLGINTPLLLATGFVRLEVYLSAAACVLMVLLGVVLGQRFGAIGVAFATAISTASSAAVRRLAVARIFGRMRLQQAM